ncbi:unnamed protein product, partial [Bodo saltans]
PFWHTHGDERIATNICASPASAPAMAAAAIAAIALTEPVVISTELVVVAVAVATVAGGAGSTVGIVAGEDVHCRIGEMVQVTVFVNASKEMILRSGGRNSPTGDGKQTLCVVMAPARLQNC